MDFSFPFLLFCSKENPILISHMCVLMVVLYFEFKLLLIHVILGGVLKYWFVNLLTTPRIIYLQYYLL